MSLDGGRKLSWEHSFSSETEVKPNRGFWNKLVDVIAGAPEFHSLVRPYSIVADSRGRIIVTDPGAVGVHVFDFTEHKYKFIERKKEKDPMLTPQCVAIDAQDNIYVTDSDSGLDGAADLCNQHAPRPGIRPRHARQCVADHRQDGSSPGRVQSAH